MQAHYPADRYRAAIYTGAPIPLLDPGLYKSHSTKRKRKVNSSPFLLAGAALPLTGSLSGVHGVLSPREGSVALARQSAALHTANDAKGTLSRIKETHSGALGANFSLTQYLKSLEGRLIEVQIACRMLSKGNQP